jgi:S-adenosylmethionine:tRNA ribosyltransferase-isomerase
MLVKDFSFNLPQGLIALHPAPERDLSRLMVLNRRTETVSHRIFKDIATFLSPGDLLVLNDTRVIPARLLGQKETGGKVEIFLLRRVAGEPERWLCMLRSSKSVRDGQLIAFSGGMIATVRSRSDAESFIVEFRGEEPFDVWLEREGHVPLPPYLQRADEALDRERYQTVFATKPGAIAAPTAGLHFTADLLDQIKQMGIRVTRLTLHTGLGTFKPVRVERVQDHVIHKEQYYLSEETAQEISDTKSAGGRVIAVGTTTARTLEYAADDNGMVRPGQGEADIFIYPGYRFKVVDGLVTNFHLPESTLLMLVCAFAGKEFVLDAYREAVASDYRFYSYGDATLIV